MNSETYRVDEKRKIALQKVVCHSRIVPSLIQPTETYKEHVNTNPQSHITSYNQRDHELRGYTDELNKKY